MSISFKPNSDPVIRNLNNSQRKLGEANDELSSGKRINKAKDDAAGLAIAGQLDAVLTILSQGSNNASIASSALDIADSAASVVSDIGTRIAELSVQAANGTLSSEQRGAIGQEVAQLTQEIQRITQTTEFNGQNLFANSGFSAQVGTDGSANSQVQVIGIDLANKASALAFDVSTPAAARASLDSAQQFISSVTENRSKLGEAQSRLEISKNINEVGKETNSAALSRIRDADIAESVTKRTAANILSNSSVALLAQANQSPQVALRLLG